MASQVPLKVLNDGRKMPALGLGTWKSGKDQVYNAVKSAIKDSGYRHIDCAHVYQNEEEVGRALKELINEGVVKREDLWITSKLWNTFHSPSLVPGAFETTLKNLQLEYLDLYLIHWPMGYQEGGDLFPRGPDGAIVPSDVDPLDTWKAMIALKQTGKVKSIGVSNFNIKQLERLINETGVVPAVNQVELHPYLPQKELLEYCNQKNIYLTAYSPLGTPDRPWASDSEPVLMNEPAVAEIAKKHNKTVAQILIKFHLARGVSVIPKSVTPSRIQSNIEVFDFELTPEELKTLENLPTNHRYCNLRDQHKHPHFPFA